MTLVKIVLKDGTKLVGDVSLEGVSVPSNWKRWRIIKANHTFYPDVNNVCKECGLKHDSIST